MLGCACGLPQLPGLGEAAGGVVKPSAFAHAMAWWAGAAMTGGGGHGVVVQN